LSECAVDNKDILPYFGTQYIGEQLRCMVEKLGGASLTPLFTHLVRSEALRQGEKRTSEMLQESPKQSDRKQR
jgi:hypothetical protein